MSYTLRKANRTSDDLNAAIEALNTEFNRFKGPAEIGAHPQFAYKAAELVRQLATDKFMMEDPTDLFLTRMTGPRLGDWLEFEEYVNTAKVVERSLGGKPRVFTPHKNKYPITLTDWRIDFGFELEQVATGQLDVGVWVEQMAEAISRYYITNALGAIDTACATGTTDMYGQSLRTSIATAVNEATIDTALKRLGDINPDVVIAGRYSTLYPIFKLGTGEIALEEFRQRGAIARFRGASLVVLRDNYNPFFSSADVPSNRIYIVGGDKGGVVAETDMSSMNYNVVDQEEQHFRVGVKGRTSFTVFKNWKYHVVEIT